MPRPDPDHELKAGVVKKAVYLGSGRLCLAPGLAVTIEYGATMRYVWDEKLFAILYAFQDDKKFREHIKITLG